MVYEMQREEPVTLLHVIVGANVALRAYGVHDEEVLQAMR